VALAALSACGLDLRVVETIGLPATTTTSTSSTTTTTRPKPTTTTSVVRPATTSTTRKVKPVGTPPPAPPSTPAPLTGLPMEPVAAGRPVLVVKIDNAPKARPQVGLNQADVVFEEGVEGGITRFAALFHSSDSITVGPVRSARSTDIALVSPLNRPLFAYSGANDVFKRYVAGAPLVDVGVERCPAQYHRDDARSSPYNLFSTTRGLFDLAPTDSRRPPALFSYRAPGEAAAGPGARPVSHARALWQGSAKLTAAAWDWDATAKGWRRTQNDEAHVDAAGRQVIPPNVIFQFVTYRDTGLVDSSGTSVPEAEVVGEGNAWVLSGGLLIPARWSKSDASSITRYVDGSGAEVRLAPGRTWVELVPPGNGDAF
jgi:DUF3048 family protein